MVKRQNKIGLILIIPLLLVMLLLSVSLFVYKTDHQDSSSDWMTKCPESYHNEQERANDLALFYADYILNHPDSNLLERLYGRMDFLIWNNCTQTLDMIKEEKGGIDNYIASLLKESLLLSFKCPEEYASLEDFKVETSKNAYMFMSATASSSPEDFLIFFKENYRNRNCRMGTGDF